MRLERTLHSCQALAVTVGPSRRNSPVKLRKTVRFSRKKMLYMRVKVHIARKKMKGIYNDRFISGKSLPWNFKQAQFQLFK